VVNDDEAMRPMLYRRRGREEYDGDGVKPWTTITAKKKTNEKKRFIPRQADRMVLASNQHRPISGLRWPNGQLILGGAKRAVDFWISYSICAAFTHNIMIAIDRN
jgi:hypothetical protein